MSFAPLPQLGPSYLRSPNASKLNGLYAYHGNEHFVRAWRLDKSWNKHATPMQHCSMNANFVIFAAMVFDSASSIHKFHITIFVVPRARHPLSRETWCFCKTILIITKIETPLTRISLIGDMSLIFSLRIGTEDRELRRISVLQIVGRKENTFN
jgi:hypothetical protein